jgi:hypothetical protein
VKPLACLGVVAASAVGATSLFAPITSSAATDTTPPTLIAPAAADFVVGSTIGLTIPDIVPGLGPTGGIQMRARWSATDASGICGYGIREVFAGSLGTWSPWGPTRSASRSTSDYNGEAGGGADKFEGYRIRARDCVGNIAKTFVSYRPAVYEEDGSTFNGAGLTSPSYRGTWRTSKCTCFSDGATRNTTQSGASVTFSTGATVRHTALVMEKSPKRGSVRVYVNGTLRATVSTHSATTVHRAVVWNGATGSARIKLVNIATAGHPRIDLDAILTDS